MKKMLFAMMLILSFSAFAEDVIGIEEDISSQDEITTQEIQNNEEQNIPQDTKIKQKNKNIENVKNSFSKGFKTLENDSLTQVISLGYDFKQEKLDTSFGILEKSFEISLGLSKDFYIEVNKIFFGGETSGIYFGTKLIDPFDKLEFTPLAGARMHISERIISEIEYAYNIKTKDDLGNFSFKYVF